MDIQPYPIQIFQVIPSFSWVELNWVGYGYYPNCSGRYYPNPTHIKKKKKTKKKDKTKKKKEKKKLN